MTIRRNARRALTRLAGNPIAEAAVRGAARTADRIDRTSADTLTILMYHRVTARGDASMLSPTMVNATPDELARQMDAVRSVATFVSVDDVLAAVLGDASLPRRSVLVTFDDAYVDFAAEAWPVLRAREVPVALFVPTAFPDHPGRALWWDRLWSALHRGGRPLRLDGLPTVEVDEPARAAFRRLRNELKRRPHVEAMQLVDEAVAQSGVRTPEATVLSWDELHELQREGVAIAAHSHTHPLLDRLDPTEAAEEIGRSIEELETRGFAHARTFAYPGGGVDDAVRAAAIRAGCDIAFTTRRGTNRLDALDPHLLRRINVGQATNTALLTAQLLPLLARSDRWAGR